MKLAITAFLLIFGATIFLLWFFWGRHVSEVETNSGVVLRYHSYTIHGDKIEIVVEKSSDGSKELIHHVTRQLKNKWPDIRQELKEGYEAYGLKDHFPPKEYFIAASLMTKDVFMGDKSDIHLQFEFDDEDLPEWHIFLTKEFEIAHCQHVY